MTELPLLTLTIVAFSWTVTALRLSVVVVTIVSWLPVVALLAFEVAVKYNMDVAVVFSTMQIAFAISLRRIFSSMTACPPGRVAVLVVETVTVVE